MKISIISRIAHVILCPFLVFGWWMFPRLGVSGAATSSVATQGLAMTLALWVVFSGQSRLRLTLRDFRLDLSVIWRMVKIGLPASVTMAQQSFGRIVLMLFIIPFGTFAVAAHSLLERIDLFIRMPALGFGRAASVLVGQTLGAQQPERAEKSTWFAMGLSEGILVISAIILFLWPGSIIRIFNSDPDLVEIASVFLRIGVIGYLTIGFDAVLGQSLTGAGDTLPPMLITLLRLWVVTIPLSYLIPRVTELGVYGIRWSIVIGMVVGTAAYLVYFRLGRWKRKRI